MLPLACENDMLGELQWPTLQALEGHYIRPSSKLSYQWCTDLINLLSSTYRNLIYKPTYECSIRHEHEISNNVVCATSKASDQPAHTHSLIIAFPMSVKLLTEHNLEFLNLKEGCAGSSEATCLKMPQCFKSHATAHIYVDKTFSFPIRHCCFSTARLNTYIRGLKTF